MGRKNARNSEVLKASKDRTSPKIYDLLLKLVNSEREDLAEIVLKIDYLFEYASICVKQRDYREAKNTLNKAKERMDKIKSEESSIDISCLEYLYEGIIKKVK
ncbi:hypothetical protein [Clostridium cylindrosporum]|uniref:Uncharacterized protein n=1 Tax=Clostridium cylindrosporum DSM 605 TaxID=1121307 RepID=A0A0J8G3A0_CLOCY|nr:hypothetical protein [Clostridium cylindrosporum]KMT22186.1 hypothetical protein CLCY_4c01590 [Clostridium cylindrosporum DSM 605]